MMKDARAELVRIDSSGTAHPIGAVASQRLRARAGAFRLLPAPDHVVFMRFTGEDGKRDAQDGAVVRVAGEITGPGTMCDILALVGQSGWTGKLIVMDGEVRRSMFVEAGGVVGVQTTDEKERLGAILYQYGVLSEHDRKRVMELVATGRRFGEAAVELGILGRSDVYKFIAKQIEEVVCSALMVHDGTFFFLDGLDPTQLASRHVVSASALLMNAVTRMDELRYFRQKIPTSVHVPVRIEGRSSANLEFNALLEHVDGRRSIEEIGRLCGLGEFETTKQVYALIQAGELRIILPRISGGVGAIIETANTVLRAAFSAAASAGKLAELERGLASFAVGAGVYDLLFRNAGPDATGALNVEAVAENSVKVADGEDPEQLLKQLLYDYASFALFSAGALLERESEVELKTEVKQAMAALRPNGAH